jgi:hypothetical protein
LLTIPAVALCSLLSSVTATDPAGEVALFEAIPHWVSFTDATDSESVQEQRTDPTDLTPREVSNEEYLRWVASMGGGDTSHMLDI